jgi:hypothetical protein
MASPLFLLAPPRSYTSLVNAMLGQHPQAFGLPELCLFNVELLVDLWKGSQQGEDGRERLHGAPRHAACGGRDLRRRAVHRQHQHGHALVLRARGTHTAEVFQELVAKLDPLVAVEKSPSYTMSVLRLRRSTGPSRTRASCTWCAIRWRRPSR